MIDEELYQQATDELTSDRRRPLVWARACALASDDHDEARYLYTNLRVEELIAERDSGIAAPSESVASATDEDDTALTLESAPVGLDETDGQIAEVLDAEEYKFDEIDVPESVSTRAGVDAESSDDSDLQQFMQGDDDESDSSLDATAELDGTAVIDLDSDELAEFQASVPAEESGSFDSKAAAGIEELQADSTASDEKPRNEALQQNDDQLDDLLGGVYPASEGAHGTTHEDAEEVLTADFSDATGTQAVLLDDELDWLDDEVAPNEVQQQQLEPYQPQALERDHTDRLTMELERQADEMPGQHSDVVSFEELDQPDVSPASTTADWPENTSIDDTENNSAHDTQTDHAAAAFTAAGAGVAATAAVASRGRDNLDLSAPYTGSIADQDINSNDGTGKQYSVYRRNQSLQAVKVGVSWSALIATLPFMIYRHLFGTAIVYTLMSIILLAGLLITGLTWFDAGIQASPLIKGATIGFAALAAIGLFYLPFRHANTWRSEKLENRGFDLVATVQAKNPGKAIARARRAVALGS